jgi:hypothetical protein
MITSVSVATDPIAVGEIRELIVHGDSPLSVAIKCFVKNPPPPGFKECKECGVIPLRSGQPHLFTVGLLDDERSQGSVFIFIKDAHGDHYTVELPVKDWGMEQGASDFPQPVIDGSPGNTERDFPTEESVEIAFEAQYVPTTATLEAQR